MSVNQKWGNSPMRVNIDQALNNAIFKMINLNDDILSLRYRPCYTQRSYLPFNRCGLLDFKLHMNGNFYFQSASKYFSWKPDWPIIKEDINIRNYFFESLNKFREHIDGEQQAKDGTELQTRHGLDVGSISSQSINRQIARHSINFNKRLEALKNSENKEDGENDRKTDGDILKSVSTYSQLTMTSETAKTKPNDSEDSKSINRKDGPFLNFNKRLEEMKNKLSKQSRNTDLDNEKNKNIGLYGSKSSASKFRKGVSDTGTAYYTVDASIRSYTSSAQKLTNEPVLNEEDSKAKLLKNLDNILYDNQSVNKNNDKFLSFNKHLHVETDSGKSKSSRSNFRKLVSDGGSVYFTAMSSVLSPILSPMRKSDLTKEKNIIHGDKTNDNTKLSQNSGIPHPGSQSFTKKNVQSLNTSDGFYEKNYRGNSQSSISKFRKLASDTRTAYFTAISTFSSDSYTPNRFENENVKKVSSLNKRKRALSENETKMNRNQSISKMNYTLFNLNKDFREKIFKGNSKSSISKFRKITSDYGTLYFTAESTYFSFLSLSKQSEAKMKSNLNDRQRSQNRSLTDSKSIRSQSKDVQKERSFNMNKDFQKKTSKENSKLSLSNFRKVVSDAGTSYYSMDSPYGFPTLPASKIQAQGMAKKLPDQR